MKCTNQLSIILLILIGFYGCQSSNIKKADNKFKYGEYFDAYNFYKKGISSVKSTEKQQRAEILVKQAIAAEKVGLHDQAVRLLLQAERSKVAPPEYNYYLGKVYHRQGKYTLAKKHYQLYLKDNPEDKLSQNGIVGCDSSSMWQKNTTRFEVKPMTVFNSKQNDFAPFVSANGDRVFFSSQRTKTTGKKKSTISGTKYADIFVSSSNGKGKWEAPELLKGEVNTLWDEGAVTLSADEKKLYLTYASPLSVAGSQILVSSLVGEEWSKPTPLIVLRDSLASVGHPSLTPDGERLFFVTSKDGKQGDNDIWVATFENGQVATVENMGNEINTPGNEIYPFCRNKEEIYFSSDGHPGLGGFDIFKATKGSDGKWVVINMGTPINSNADDLGMTFAGIEDMGYFSSNRNQTRNIDNIFSFELPSLRLFIKGNVTDELNRPIEKAHIHIVSNHGENKKFETQSKKGTFQYRMSKNAKFLIQASCEGYLNASTEIVIEETNQDKEYPITLTLLPISKPIEMDNIFFDLNQSSLREESYKALDQLIKILNDNPNVTIELSAHTDRAGSDEYNITLSNSRAQTVVDYLASKGIDQPRLTPKGYGKMQPKIVDSITAEKHSFLSEGDILSEEYVTKLKPEQQIICDQINRRTEFRVLKVNYNLF